jgi:hypothetical protein
MVKLMLMWRRKESKELGTHVNNELCTQAYTLVSPSSKENFLRQIEDTYYITRSCMTYSQTLDSIVDLTLTSIWIQRYGF